MRSTIDHVDWSQIDAIADAEPDRDYVSWLWAVDWNSPEDEVYD